ncbi:hypothetical protein FRC03_004285 [Tulasnella sp. 419]|nr:hypothetical protein FRC03_004285 [Tulasnella sp. 419]
MVENFDQQLQCNFRDRQQDLLVRFGRDQDNDPEFDINEGQLLVRGEEMATFYEPVCRAVVDSVKAKVIPNSKTTVVLVGGFAGNRYLFEEVQRRLPGIPVFRPHGAAVTVSANGAICFYLDRSVTARMAKWTYGVSCVHDFNPKNPKHVRRISRVQRNPVTGQRFIDGGFLVTLKKGTLIQETELTRFPFWHSQTERTATTLNIVLECYRGDVPDIQFRDEDSQERFHELCWFKVAIPETSLRRAQKVKRRSALLRSTQYYYVSNFHIVVSFGAMEFKFHIEWRDEQGRTHRGSLTPIWNEFEDHLPSAADSRSRYPDPSARMSYDALSIAHSGQTNFSEQDYSSIWSQSRLSLLSITTLDVEGPVPPLQRDRERLPRLPQLQELSSASTNLSLTLLNEVGPGLTEPSESYDQFVSEGEIRGSDLAPGRPPLAWEGDIEFQFLNSQSVCTPRLIVACDDWAVSASSEVLLFTLSSVGYKATQRLLGSVNYLRE